MKSVRRLTGGGTGPAAVAGREKAFPTLVPLHGKQFLVQIVNGLPYHVAPLAFFQTNTKQTGLLLDIITKAAGALPPMPLFLVACLFPWVCTEVPFFTGNLRCLHARMRELAKRCTCAPEGSEGMT